MSIFIIWSSQLLHPAYTLKNTKFCPLSSSPAHGKIINPFVRAWEPWENIACPWEDPSEALPPVSINASPPSLSCLSEFFINPHQSKAFSKGFSKGGKSVLEELNNVAWILLNFSPLKWYEYMYVRMILGGEAGLTRKGWHLLQPAVPGVTWLPIQPSYKTININFFDASHQSVRCSVCFQEEF